MNLVLHNIFRVYHYTILFKWITRFWTDLSHPFQFLSFPKVSSSSPSRYNPGGWPFDEALYLIKSFKISLVSFSPSIGEVLADPSILESPTFETDKPPSHVDDFKTPDWRDVTDLSVFSEFFRVDATDQSIDFFRVDRWQNIPKKFQFLMTSYLIMPH